MFRHVYAAEQLLERQLKTEALSFIEYYELFSDISKNLKFFPDSVDLSFGRFQNFPYGRRMSRTGRVL